MLTSLDTTDVTWNYYSAVMWSWIEMSIGTICACLPVLGPLLPKWFLDKHDSHTVDPTYERPIDTLNVGRQRFNQLDDAFASESYRLRDNPMNISGTADSSFTHISYKA